MNPPAARCEFRNPLTDDRCDLQRDHEPPHLHFDGENALAWPSGSRLTAARSAPTGEPTDG